MDKIIKINNSSDLLSKKEMTLKIFRTDFRLIRFITMMITKNAPPCIRDINLLEQQISEVIKNAAKHGNKYDPDKSIKIWYKFNKLSAHIIVEDQGEGFSDIEKWNHLKLLRDKAFRERDYNKMFKYAAWKGKNSKEDDGGNSLFAALEYWNEGVVFNEQRNTIALKRRFSANSECNRYMAIS